MECNPSGEPTYSPDHFAALFAAEDTHFWFQSRNSCISAALRSLPGFSEIADVLEVGCGTGVVLAELRRLLPRARVVGLDLFEEGLMLARQRFDGPLVQGDVMACPFSAKFDVLGAFDVIEHLDDDATALGHFRDLLKPGGHLILTVPAHQALWSHFDTVAHHRRRYAGAGLRQTISSAGYSDIYITHFMAALFPVMWLKRRLFGAPTAATTSRDIAQQQAAVESDLRIHPWANTLLGALVRPEAFLVSRRFRGPLGTSLLAVARR